MALQAGNWDQPQGVKVTWYFRLSLIGLFYCLIGLLTQSFALADQVRLPKALSDDSVSPSIPQPKRSLEPSEMSERQLDELSRSITVKVLCGKQWGSGILVSRQGTTYRVLTNAHVLKQCYGTEISVQTPDNKLYSISSVNRVHGSNYDLSVVSFSSKQNYSTASFDTTNPYVIGSDVFAAGFPLEANETQTGGFAFNVGQIKRISDKSFEDGYQIGYTSQVETGMSGGPLLNRRGQVIGINGIQSYPPWGSPYAFDDGSIPTKAVWEQMQQLSWAIPVRTFINSGFSYPVRINDATVVSLPGPGLGATVSPNALLGTQTDDINHSATVLDAPMVLSPLEENQTGLNTTVSLTSLRDEQMGKIDYSAMELDSFFFPHPLKEKPKDRPEYTTFGADQSIW